MDAIPEQIDETSNLPIIPPNLSSKDEIVLHILTNNPDENLNQKAMKLVELGLYKYRESAYARLQKIAVKHLDLDSVHHLHNERLTREIVPSAIDNLHDAVKDKETWATKEALKIEFRHELPQRANVINIRSMQVLNTTSLAQRADELGVGCLNADAIENNED